MNGSKLNKVLRLLIVPELALAVYIILFWVFLFLLQTAISASRI